MCYHTSTPEEQKLRKYLNDYDIVNYDFYYHTSGFDHQYLPVTTNAEPKKVLRAIWGLVPESITTSEKAKEVADMLLNAKSETIFEKPSFKNYIGSKRCLIWVDGFYEWQHRDKGKTKIPYYIYMKDHVPFSFGGLYTNWARPDTGEVMTTTSIITTASNTLMSEIHNNKKRMPLIISPEDRAKWLGKIDKDDIQALMHPYPDGELLAHTVSKTVSQPGAFKNYPEIQEEVKYDNGLW